MSYDKPRPLTYSFGPLDFGTGDTAHAFQGPAGLAGKIVDAGVMVTEVFNQVTTPGRLQAGIAAGGADYLDMNMAAAAATDYYGLADDTDAIVLDDIPADTQIEVTCLAPPCGTPTGIGHCHITVEWY